MGGEGSSGSGYGRVRWEGRLKGGVNQKVLPLTLLTVSFLISKSA